MSVQKYFAARDGKKLSYRLLELPSVASETPKKDHTTVICLHGSSYSSQRYLMFGRSLLAQGYHVCLPDWRGHGGSEGEPGDLHYEGQLQDDLKDLVQHLKQSGFQNFVVGGHSAGSIIALKYIAEHTDHDIKAFFAIAPPLSQTDETRLSGKTGWLQNTIRYWRSRPSLAKTEILSEVDSRLNRYSPKLLPYRYWLAHFFPIFRQWPVMIFPSAAHHQSGVKGAEERVLEYKFRLVQSFSIFNYPELFSSVRIPTKLIVGEFDEVVNDVTLSVILNWYLTPHLPHQLTLIPRANHMSVVLPSAKALTTWLSEHIPAKNLEQAA